MIPYRKCIIFSISLAVVATTLLLSTGNYFWATTITWNKTQDISHFLVPSFYDESTLKTLANLSTLHWPNEAFAIRPARRGMPLPPAFKPIVSKLQRELLHDLLYQFSNILAKNHLGDQYMLYGGTLLGSVRHHDLIPWDEDIDVFVNASCRDHVRALLKTLEPDYVLHQGPRDKLFARPIDTSQEDVTDVKGSRPVSRWAWPFLDIMYFEDDGTNIYEKGSHTRYNRAFVVPLLFRPLGKHWYPAPRKYIAFLKYDYPIPDMCQTIKWYHVDEIPVTSTMVECRSLWKTYAFVKRGNPCSRVSWSSWPLGMLLIEEQLILDNSDVIHTLCLPITYPDSQDISYSIA